MDQALGVMIGNFADKMLVLQAAAAPGANLDTHAHALLNELIDEAGEIRGVVSIVHLCFSFTHDCIIYSGLRDVDLARHRPRPDEDLHSEQGSSGMSTVFLFVVYCYRTCLTSTRVTSDSDTPVAENNGRNVGCGIAYTTFINIWNAKFPHVKIPPKSRFTKCTL